MSVILLANVGNSDLEIEPKELLPPLRMSSRSLGEEVLQNYGKYEAHIQLPLVLSALEYIVKHEAISLNEIEVNLFASDQVKAITPESEWAKDTAPVAEVIKQYLFKKGIPKKQIKIHKIEGNPADYTNALYFHRDRLAEVHKNISPNTRVYLEVSGGTPAMTAMLILMGVETFGQDVSTLYLDRSSKEAYRIDVAQVLFARKTREALRNQIHLYAYASALNTLEVNGALIVRDDQNRNLLARLLGYADRRLAFDYERAREELREARAIGEMQARLRFWQNELREKDTAKTIAELINSAIIKLNLGEYADFTQRLFRFQEATFRYMAEKMGIKYSQSGDQYLSVTWFTSQVDLDNYLKEYLRHSNGIPLLQPNLVDVKRSLNRYNLGAIVEYFVTQTPDWKHLQTTIDQLFLLSSVADLRNKGIAGHGFEGVSRADIEAKYEHSLESLIDNLKQIYKDVFEVEVPDNPYDALNTLIMSLIEENV